MTGTQAPVTAAAGSAPDRGGEGRPGRGKALRYIAGRLLTSLLSLVAVMFTAFFLFRILPGDPVRAMTEGRSVSVEQMEELRRQFGLDKPLPQQFVDYCLGLLRFDLGVSYQYRVPVVELIADRLWPTVLLSGTGTLLAALLGLWLGTRSAWRRGSVSDRVNSGVALTLWSVPTFWFGLILIVLLASGADLFPTGGMMTPGTTGAVAVTLDVAHHMVLPVATMVAVLYAQYLMIMRSSLLDEMGGDYLVTARAKGLRDALVLRRHAVPNALLPAVTLIFLNIGLVASGAILVETVFSWPGLGTLFYEALSVPDLPLVQALFIFFSAAVILMNLVADLVYPLLDPRVRS
ncbi:ABC transporter permease [Marinactinospora thermotolerans]|uniref:Peptide/nickel transport system permease protein n=1 Tax=Marinactinospora thermotolerans DSM 45154 TaxID=1122192 RepID=A0A1T4M9P4_9ACTN|nr:ABC transporter permease [Marinactinospora thermotolerans]SJZ63566.1 peptide/nickel transport system permease protein [Marinactinospora thermotolerans DSM 45154]